MGYFFTILSLLCLVFYVYSMYDIDDYRSKLLKSRNSILTSKSAREKIDLILPVLKWFLLGSKALT